MPLFPVSLPDFYGLLLLLVIIMPIPLALLVTWDGLTGPLRRLLFTVAGANLASLMLIILLADVL
ncbi:hypothetical protein [Novispirillum itersonii]|uniref:Uncharacterized protein n=1 Tax=Novispirillum itersonii TaxID=189 RepID=A0A7X0DM00_NOVIT|nr:hypothetical protein [Novispirillum itersonii]MBB6208712.1 hypothetical protein [Novispirillum itersonii]